MSHLTNPAIEALSYILSRGEVETTGTADVKFPAMWFDREALAIKFYSFDEFIIIPVLDELKIPYKIETDIDSNYYKYFIFNSIEDFNTTCIMFKLHYRK